MASRFLLCLAVALGAVIAHAGQMSSHVYTAIRAVDYLSPDDQVLVRAHMPAYLAGAQGPDTTGVVQHVLDGYSTGASVGEETHYDPKKAELALQVLDCARNDNERAYAIGWISHYVNDINIHATVNEYGGYYADFPLHHKELEQLETKHVIIAHSDLVTKDRTSQDYAAEGATFPEFVFDAFAKTFPDDKLYKPEKKAYFCTRYQEAAAYCANAHKVFYATATTKSQKGDHGWVKESKLFPKMPSFDDYDHFLRALEIVNVQAGKDKITATLRVYDNKLYGRFLADWEAAADHAVTSTSPVYAVLSAYCAAKPAEKPARRAALLALIPKANLDQPKDGFTAGKAFPGDKPWQIPYFSCVITPMDAPNAPKEVNGRLKPITVTSTGWAGSEQGEVAIEIPVPGGAYPYDFTLGVALTGKDDFKVPAYALRSWVRTTGSSDTTGDARVTVGEVFPVSFTLSPDLAKLPGTRVWYVTSDEPDDGKHLAGRIKGSATPFNVSRETPGTLPGNREFIPVLNQHRYDVKVVEEQLAGDVLTAKLQLTNPALTHHLGAQRLVCVFMDHPQDSAMDYSTAYRAWQAANRRAKVAYDLIDAKIEALTDAQRAQLQAQGEAFVADLEKQGKNDAEMEKAMMAKQVELLGTVGLKLTPEHLALIDAERAADAERERKSTSRHCAIGKFIVQPCQIMLDVPNGWQEEACDITETLRRSLTKAITTRNADGTPLMAASASVDITCTDAADAEKKFQTQKAGTRDERSALTIGGYTGPCYTNTEAMGDDESVLRLDALLLRGGLYVRVRISVHSRGYLITAGNTVITDGRGVASATYGTLCAEANALLASFRLPARPTPEK